MNNRDRNPDERERFAFGENWRRFLRTLDESRIQEAEDALRRMLGAEDLDGRTFLDAGCGSGLSSLAAGRLGAKVVSFDRDPECVACAETLKERYFSDDPVWRIETGDVLDRKYLASLGRFDVVYSWGVLHHTGNMLEAMDRVGGLVSSGGRLFISIYNDQGGAGRRWRAVKKAYVRSNAVVRFAIVLAVATYFELRSAAGRLAGGMNPLPFRHWRLKKKDRGMSVWSDYVDWSGGYPFETAKPEDVFHFYRERGFALERLKTCGGGHGCNEFVFRRIER